MYLYQEAVREAITSSYTPSNKEVIPTTDKKEELLIEKDKEVETLPCDDTEVNPEVDPENDNEVIVEKEKKEEKIK